MPFLSFFYFRFIGRHCYFRLSADIGDSTVETAAPENRGVALKFRFYLVGGVKLTEGWQICHSPTVRVTKSGLLSEG